MLRVNSSSTLSLFLAVIFLAFIPPARGADCNSNGIDDSLDIASGTSADCNSDGIPDECGVVPVDVVFIVDISPSVDPEGVLLCSEINQIQTQLATDGVLVGTIGILAVNRTPTPPNYTCVTANILNRFGGTAPGDGSCGPITLEFSQEESWGPATAIIAERFPWTSAPSESLSR
jgi:hypothetical protein